MWSVLLEHNRDIPKNISLQNQAMKSTGLVGKWGEELGSQKILVVGGHDGMYL